MHSLTTDVDAAGIAAKSGIRGHYLIECLHSLTARGFLSLSPSGLPHVVRLTNKGAEPTKEQENGQA